MSAREAVGSAIAVFLILSPFLLLWMLWTLFNPQGFWESIALFCMGGITCFTEGVVAWLLALTILDEIW